MGRISTPWLRQSAKPRRARRATLTSIKGNTPCGPGPGVRQHCRGIFTVDAPTCGARHGGEKAPAQRERKGSERRKVFAKQNPEGGQAKPGRAFGASLARRTAGATLLPLCVLPFSSSGSHRLLTSLSRRVPPSCPLPAGALAVVFVNSPSLLDEHFVVGDIDRIGTKMLPGQPEEAPAR